MISVGRPESSSTESSESEISCYSLTVYRCCEVCLNVALLLKLSCKYVFEYRLVWLIRDDLSG